MSVSETKRDTKKVKLGRSCRALFRIKLFQWFLKYRGKTENAIFKFGKKLVTSLFLHVQNSKTLSKQALVVFFLAIVTFLLFFQVIQFFYILNSIHN